MRPAWITPREEPETIEFHRKVPLWELGEIAEEITDADYRKGCRGCDEHATHWMPDPDPPETTP